MSAGAELAWLVPVFWVVVLGLFWKRNHAVAITALLVSWALNSLWTFTALPAALGLAGVHNAYVTFFSSLIIMTVGNLFLSGRPAFMSHAERATAGAAPAPAE